MAVSMVVVVVVIVMAVHPGSCLLNIEAEEQVFRDFPTVAPNLGGVNFKVSHFVKKQIESPLIQPFLRAEG